MGDQIVFFGGEVNPSEKGHEGAGAFSNNLLVLDGKTGKVLSQPLIETTPPNRGWSCAAVWNSSSLLVFAGLAGDDTNPIRLDDTWLLSKSAKVKADL